MALNNSNQINTFGITDAEQRYRVRELAGMAKGADRDKIAFEEFCRADRERSAEGMHALSAYLGTKGEYAENLIQYLREKHGTVFSLSELIGNIGNRLGLYRKYTLNEYYEMLDIYTNGMSGFAEPSLPKTLIAVGRLIQSCVREEEVWVPRFTKTPKEENAWRHFCEGGYYPEIRTELLSCVFPSGDPDICFALSQMQAMYKDSSAPVWKLFAEALCPCESGGMLENYASALISPNSFHMYHFFRALVSNSGKLDVQIRDKLLQVAHIWNMRLLQMEEEKGNTLALFHLYQLDAVTSAEAANHPYAPYFYPEMISRYELLKERFDKRSGFSLDVDKLAFVGRVVNKLEFSGLDGIKRIQKDVAAMREHNKKCAQEARQGNWRVAELLAEGEIDRKQVDREIDDYVAAAKNKQRTGNYLGTGLPLTGEEMGALGGSLAANDNTRDLGLNMLSLGVTEQNALYDRAQRKREKMLTPEYARVSEIYNNLFGNDRSSSYPEDRPSVKRVDMTGKENWQLTLPNSAGAGRDDRLRMLQFEEFRKDTIRSFMDNTEGVK